MLKQLRKQSGFTIIELLIVIAIIGVLALLVITNFQGAQAKGRDTLRQNNINALYTKLEEYHNENGHYPTEDFTTDVFPGIDAGAFEDPDGDDIIQSAPVAADTQPSDPYTTGSGNEPTGAEYTYAPYSCTGTTAGTDTCQKYVLYGWNETGESGDPSYTRSSLN